MIKYVAKIHLLYPLGIAKYSPLVKKIELGNLSELMPTIKFFNGQEFAAISVV
jgi:hypothetical protein